MDTDGYKSYVKRYGHSHIYKVKIKAINDAVSGAGYHGNTVVRTGEKEDVYYGFAVVGLDHLDIDATGGGLFSSHAFPSLYYEDISEMTAFLRGLLCAPRIQLNVHGYKRVEIYENEDNTLGASKKEKDDTFASFGDNLFTKFRAFRGR
ncbi:MAG: hypothetical protein LBT10_02255 [Methanobrevibacter sp.]|jgi:hypothetical protein|nr:hypothetical protein [Methanobrevibacter sp.]